MDHKVILLLLLPIAGLVLVFGFGVLMIRGGREIKFQVKGFGVQLSLNSDAPEVNFNNSNKRKE